MCINHFTQNIFDYKPTNTQVHDALLLQGYALGLEPVLP